MSCGRGEGEGEGGWEECGGEVTAESLSWSWSRMEEGGEWL